MNRFRSERFFSIVRDAQIHGLKVDCMVCGKKGIKLEDQAVLTCCGHVGMFSPLSSPLLSFAVSCSPLDFTLTFFHNIYFFSFLLFYFIFIYLFIFQGCMKCLYQKAENQKCPAPGCTAPARVGNVYPIAKLEADKDHENPGTYGTKLRRVVDIIKKTKTGEYVTVFVQVTTPSFLPLYPSPTPLLSCYFVIS